MTQTEVNRIIQEKVRGGCWHIFEHTIREFDAIWLCHCGEWYRGEAFDKRPADGGPDFSQWPDYGPLLEEIQGRGYLDNLMNFIWDKVKGGGARYRKQSIYLLNPTRGSLAIAEFVLANPELFKED